MTADTRVGLEDGGLTVLNVADGSDVLLVHRAARSRSKTDYKTSAAVGTKVEDLCQGREANAGHGNGSVVVGRARRPEAKNRRRLGA